MRSGLTFGQSSTGNLPNITSYISMHVRTKVNGSATGAFYVDSVGNAYSGNYWEGGQGNLGFDSSRCSSIYGRYNLDKVLTSFITMHYIIKY